MENTIGFEGKRFLVIGRAGMDFYAEPVGTPIEAAHRFTAALGGSSANIAVALVRQGMEAALLTCVSDDAVGRFALAELDRYGVRRGLVRPVAGDARNSLAVVDTNGEATEAVIYRNGAADLEMAEADVARIDWDEVDALVTTGTVLTAEPSRGAVLSAIRGAKAAGRRVVFDIDYRPYNWPSREAAAAVYSRVAEAANIVVGNDVEFDVFAAGAGAGRDAARALAAGRRIVVYKMGGAGAVLCTRAGETRFGVYPTEALKPTGAGDAFLGGFLAALAGGHTLPDAMRRGAASAAIVVSRVGCAPAMPTAAELDAFLADHPDVT